MSSPIGLHRVLEPKGVLPQAAQRLDASPALAEDEVLVRVERLNLDAASFRQLWQQCDGDGDRGSRGSAADRADPRQDAQPGHRLGWHADRHGREVGPASTLGFQLGDRIATLVSLTLTPLHIADGLAALGRAQRAGAV